MVVHAILKVIKLSRKLFFSHQVLLTPNRTFENTPRDLSHADVKPTWLKSRSLHWHIPRELTYVCYKPALVNLRML